MVEGRGLLQVRCVTLSPYDALTFKKRTKKLTLAALG